MVFGILPGNAGEMIGVENREWDMGNWYEIINERSLLLIDVVFVKSAREGLLTILLQEGFSLKCCIFMI